MEAIPSTFVFLDDASRPFLIHNGWLHRWHPDKVWVTNRPVTRAELPAMLARRINPEHEHLYKVPTPQPVPPLPVSGAAVS